MNEPFTVRSSGGIRTAVTGHRDSALTHADRVVLNRRIDELLEGIASAALDRRPGQPMLFSALAEGADRLVAERALACNYGLVVLLPFPPHVYEADFGSSESMSAFRALLTQASHVEVVRPTTEKDDDLEQRQGASRDSAYAALGHRLVRDAEVLIALWDGEPARGGGGTAEVVAAASERQIPVVWVNSVAPHEVRAFSASHPPTVIPPPVAEGVHAVIADCLAAPEAPTSHD